MPHAAVQTQTSTRSVAKMSSRGILLLLLLFGSCYGELQEDYQPGSPPQPEHMDGRSFFFLGTLFRRWRDRWLAFHNPAPLYAGPAYPINGYYNCPAYGCNPATIGPQPGFYPAYYAAPMPPQTQQSQAAQGNSNVYIYQADQNNAAGAAGMSPPTPYGPGFFSPARQPLPQAPAFPASASFPLPAALPPPPPAMPQTPASSPPQASASSYGFASGENSSWSWLRSQSNVLRPGLSSPVQSSRVQFGDT